MANNLNKRAIKNLSVLEMQRICKALGLENIKIETFEQLREFIDNGFNILKGDFMKFRYTFPERNCMYLEMDKCFAFEGMKMIGVNKGYEFALIFRVCCWLDVLGIKCKLRTKINDYLLYSQDKCEGDIYGI